MSKYVHKYLVKDGEYVTTSFEKIESKSMDEAKKLADKLIEARNNDDFDYRNYKTKQLDSIDSFIDYIRNTNEFTVMPTENKQTIESRIEKTE